MTKYNKLIRDKIPDIIKQKGGTPVTHIATPDEYEKKLRDKLVEEVKEFLDSSNPEELADIMEVIYALSGRLGVDKKALEDLRKRKADDRGGFEQGIILEES